MSEIKLCSDDVNNLQGNVDEDEVNVSTEIKINDPNDSEKSFESCDNKDDDSEKSFASCSPGIENKVLESKIVDNLIESDDEDDIRPGSCREEASSEDEGSSWDEKNDEWVYDEELIIHSKDGSSVPKAQISEENLRSCEADLREIIESHVHKNDLLSEDANKKEKNIISSDETCHEKSKSYISDKRKKEINVDPSIIPTSGKFYMHDLRTEDEQEKVENKQNVKTIKKDEGRWQHDLFGSQERKSQNRNQGINYNTYPNKGNKRRGRRNNNSNTRSYYNDYYYDPYYIYSQDPYYYNYEYYNGPERSYDYHWEDESKPSHHYPSSHELRNDKNPRHNPNDKNSRLRDPTKDRNAHNKANSYFDDQWNDHRFSNERGSGKTSLNNNVNNSRDLETKNLCINEPLHDRRNAPINHRRNHPMNTQRIDQTNENSYESKNDFKTEVMNVRRNEPIVNRKNTTSNNMYNEHTYYKKSEHIGDHRKEPINYYRNDERNEQMSDRRGAKFNDRRNEPIIEGRNEPINDRKRDPRNEHMNDRKNQHMFDERNEQLNYRRNEPINDRKNEAMNDRRNESINDRKNEPMNNRRNESINDRKNEPMNNRRNESMNDRRNMGIIDRSKEPITYYRNEQMNNRMEIDDRRIPLINNNNARQNTRYYPEINDRNVHHYDEMRNKNISHHNSSFAEDSSRYKPTLNEVVLRYTPPMDDRNPRINHRNESTRNWNDHRDRMNINTNNNDPRSNDISSKHGYMYKEEEEEKFSGRREKIPSGRSKYSDVKELTSIKVTVDSENIGTRQIKNLVPGCSDIEKMKEAKLRRDQCQWDVSHDLADVIEEMPPLTEREMEQIKQKPNKMHNPPPRFSRTDNVDKSRGGKGPMSVPKRYSEMRPSGPSQIMSGMEYYSNLQPMLLNLSPAMMGPSSPATGSQPSQYSMMPLSPPHPIYLSPYYMSPQPQSRLNQFSEPFHPKSSNNLPPSSSSLTATGASTAPAATRPVLGRT